MNPLKLIAQGLEIVFPPKTCYDCKLFQCEGCLWLRRKALKTDFFKAKVTEEMSFNQSGKTYLAPRIC